MTVEGFCARLFFAAGCWNRYTEMRRNKLQIPSTKYRLQSYRVQRYLHRMQSNTCEAYAMCQVDIRADITPIANSRALV